MKSDILFVVQEVQAAVDVMEDMNGEATVSILSNTE